MTVFAQIMSLIPRYEFDKCVKRYNGNRHAIEFKCRDPFMVMSFAQFTDQVSLRSIDATLVALSSKLYSSGIKYIQRSTLAHINETKDWRIYRKHPTPMTILLHPQCLLGIQSNLRS